MLNKLPAGAQVEEAEFVLAVIHAIKVRYDEDGDGVISKHGTSSWNASALGEKILPRAFFHHVLIVCCSRVRPPRTRHP